MRTTLITGITGQDGSLLAESLARKGVRVLAGVRGDANTNSEINISASCADIARSLEQWEVDAVVNLGGMTFSPDCDSDPLQCYIANAQQPVRLFEAARLASRPVQILQASSCEMFGESNQVPQDETTTLNPRSPYAVSKAFAHRMASWYREHFCMHVSTAILYPHESERRGLHFLGRKIARGVALIVRGHANELNLGSLDASRDWLHASDVIRAMEIILAQQEPSDWVIASGEFHSVRNWCDVAFGYVGLDYRDFVKLDPSFQRSTKGIHLGDSSKLQNSLGWRPLISFNEMIRRMVESELQAVDNL